MHMIRQFTKCIREYKKPTLLTLLCMVGEVTIEVLIPFYTANLINEVKAGAALSGIVRVGLILVLMALISLACGALGGNILEDAFGIVAMVAMTPLIAIEILGLVYRLKTKGGKQAPLGLPDEGEEEIIDM